MTSAREVLDGARDGQIDGVRESIASIRIQGARKHFRRGDGTFVPAVDGIDLTVDDGEFVVLLGPSGCGKTTLLRSIAGLEDLDAGLVQVRDRILFDKSRKINLPPEHRQIGMMFQSYALWPHMSVAQNVAYPLASQKLRKPEIHKRVQEMLAVVGIQDLAGQYPSQISGGQQQRVALARALVAGHGVVLFDEPLSNVDARVRDHLRTELRRLHQELGFTAIYVTHDQDEALALATKVTVLRDGKVAQAAPPREVYQEPADAYVARFMGTANESHGTVRTVSAGGTAVVETAMGPVTGAGQPGLTEGMPVVVFTRPEKWRVDLHQQANVNSWRARLDSEFFHGFYTDRLFAVGTEAIRTRGFAERAAAGRDYWIHVDPRDVRILAEPQ